MSAAVTLRPYREQDRAALRELLQNEVICQTYMIPVFTSPAQVDALVEKLFALSRRPDRYERGVYVGEALVGFVNDVEIEGDRVEVGYAIHPAHAGKGYATAALGLAIAELAGRGFRHIEAGAFADNAASFRVMQKCGMRPLAKTDTVDYRGVTYTCAYYAWHAPQATTTYNEGGSIAMYPLLLKPPVKDYLWGGQKLKSEFGLQTDTEIAAEGWMLSCHKDASGTVLNGEMKGKALPEVLALWGQAALGKRAAAFAYFPILIKLIDAKDKLSIQVHPDDDYAMEHEGEYGKTEMWYVVDCEEGAQLVYGFNKAVSKEELEARIKDNTLTDICNYVPVKKGDVFFIAAGTLHAIGAGILIAEVQQNSNTTYRVSDYGRLGVDGQPRALHIDKALDVTNRSVPTTPYGAIGQVENKAYGSERELAKCRFFTSKILSLSGETPLCTEESFASLVILDGTLTLRYGEQQLSARKGDSLFIPAGMNVYLAGQAEILYSEV